MRDLLLILFAFAMLPTSFVRPYIGLLMWAWFGYMLPHTFGWSYAVNFRFVYLISLVTMAGMFFSRPQQIRFRLNMASSLMLLFTFWCYVTTNFAMNPGAAWWELDRTIKITLMLWATLALIDNKEKLHQLLLVITLSLAFYGVRGAIFTLIHGGVHRVHGPHGGFFWDNNAVGLAMLLVVPLLRYFYLYASSNINRIFYGTCFAATILSIVATYSRGSNVGLAVVLLILILKTRQRWRWLMMIVPVLLLISNFMPQEWGERMDSIKNYESDRASTGRLNAWQAAINIANEHPFVGGGFSVLTRRIFQKYAPDPNNYHDAHSIYFEALAEQGYVGLFFFLAFYLTCYRYGSIIIKFTTKRPDLAWMKDLAAMLQVSLVGYASAGAFLGMAYFDLPWHLGVCLIILKEMLPHELNRTPDSEANTKPLASMIPTFRSIYGQSPPTGK